LPQPPKNVLFSKQEAGQRIRALREARGITQVELAKALGIDQSNVSAIERGIRGLTVHQVLKLARELRVSTDEILSGATASDNGSSDRRFLRRVRKIDTLSKRQKDALLLTIDTFLKAPGGR